MELIAHRAGNVAGLVGPGLDAAGAIEVDVHLFRGRLEVRHAKVLLWPFARLWEKWEILPADAPRPPLAEILRHVPAEVHVWFDLKGVTSRLPRAVHDLTGDRGEVTYSCRAWWVLGWVRRHTSARAMRSVGNRWQRWLVVRTRPDSRGPADGIAIHARLLDGDWLARLLAVTPTVFAWGVHDLVRARELQEQGVSGLILDDLDLVRTLRGTGA